jgi:hypothetical protein
VAGTSLTSQSPSERHPSKHDPVHLAQNHSHRFFFHLSCHANPANICCLPLTTVSPQFAFSPVSTPRGLFKVSLRQPERPVREGTEPPEKSLGALEGLKDFSLAFLRRR